VFRGALDVPLAVSHHQRRVGRQRFQLIERVGNDIRL
jgi:hypothetical protein